MLGVLYLCTRVFVLSPYRVQGGRYQHPLVGYQAGPVGKKNPW